MLKYQLDNAMGQYVSWFGFDKARNWWDVSHITVICDVTDYTIWNAFVVCILHYSISSSVESLRGARPKYFTKMCGLISSYCLLFWPDLNNATYCVAQWLSSTAGSTRTSTPFPVIMNKGHHPGRPRPIKLRMGSHPGELGHHGNLIKRLFEASVFVLMGDSWDYN